MSLGSSSATWLLIGGAVLLLVGGGAAVVAVKLSARRAAFVARLNRALLNFGLSKSTRAIIISQAIHESGDGTGAAAQAGSNFWNITAGSAWKGAITMGGDTYCPGDGTSGCSPITQKFRKYPNDVEAVRDYLSFLKEQNPLDSYTASKLGRKTGEPRYAIAFQRLMSGNGDGFVTELRKAGYFTQDLPTYLGTTRKIRAGVTQAIS